MCVQWRNRELRDRLTTALEFPVDTRPFAALASRVAARRVVFTRAGYINAHVAVVCFSRLALQYFHVNAHLVVVSSEALPSDAWVAAKLASCSWMARRIESYGDSSLAGAVI